MRDGRLSLSIVRLRLQSTSTLMNPLICQLTFYLSLRMLRFLQRLLLLLLYSADWLMV
jgi:hypothetical protein